MNKRILHDLPRTLTIQDFLDTGDRTGNTDGWTLTARGIAAIEGGADTASRFTDEPVTGPRVFIMTDVPQGMVNMLEMFDDEADEDDDDMYGFTGADDDTDEDVQPSEYQVMLKSINETRDIITEYLDNEEAYETATGLLDVLVGVVASGVTLGNAQAALDVNFNLDNGMITY